MLRCVGGEVGATSTLAPKIGPLGLVIMLFFVCLTMCKGAIMLDQFLRLTHRMVILYCNSKKTNVQKQLINSLPLSNELTVFFLHSITVAKESR